VRSIIFVLCLIWLAFFALMGAIHDYEWMLADPSLDIHSWCDLPPEQDPIRRELYLLFLAQFGVVGFLFLRQKTPLFIAAMILLFGYATYAFIGRDMLCHQLNFCKS